MTVLWYKIQLKNLTSKSVLHLKRKVVFNSGSKSKNTLLRGVYHRSSLFGETTEGPGHRLLKIRNLNVELRFQT